MCIWIASTVNSRICFAGAGHKCLISLQVSPQGMLSLTAYLRFWGWVYLIITVIITFFKREATFSSKTGVPHRQICQYGPFRASLTALESSVECHRIPWVRSGPIIVVRIYFWGCTVRNQCYSGTFDMSGTRSKTLRNLRSRCVL